MKSKDMLKILYESASCEHCPIWLKCDKSEKSLCDQYYNAIYDELDKTEMFKLLTDVKIVLLTKDMKFYCIMKYETFDAFLTYNFINETARLTLLEKERTFQVWTINLGRRKLKKLLEEFNEYEYVRDRGDVEE